MLRLYSIRLHMLCRPRQVRDRDACPHSEQCSAIWEISSVSRSSSTVLRGKGIAYMRLHACTYNYQATCSYTYGSPSVMSRTIRGISNSRMVYFLPYSEKAENARFAVTPCIIRPSLIVTSLSRLLRQLTQILTTRPYSLVSSTTFPKLYRGP